MSMRRDNRTAAMQFLYQWSINRPESLERDLELFYQGLDGDHPRDYYAFADELVHGVIQQIEALDAIIQQYSRNWNFVRVARVDLAILRLALYEMTYRPDIPPIVSINEAIDLSKRFSNPDSKRFINGILDQYKLTLVRPLRDAAD
jgi:transcription antitermination protein NusB